jgi:fatty acyl-CoA reductase
MRRLRGFVHLSTAYVNCNRARGSHVAERLFPFFHGSSAAVWAAPRAAEGEVERCAAGPELAKVEGLAQELAALPEAAASQRVCAGL